MSNLEKNKTVALKALIVDDNAMNRLVMDRLLRSIGVETVVVASGADALDAVQNNVIDFIMMDILMPDMDGHEASNLIRGLGYLDLKIFGCSAHSFASDYYKNHENGMNEHLSKPILLKNIKDLIEKYFDKRL
tara:strand:- start:99 stop:497 length:399 start_codon:yes stop_codon:yes gene_type:complete